MESWVSLGRKEGRSNVQISTEPGIKQGKLWSERAEILPTAQTTPALYTSASPCNTLYVQLVWKKGRLMHYIYYYLPTIFFTDFLHHIISKITTAVFLYLFCFYTCHNWSVYPVVHLYQETLYHPGRNTSNIPWSHDIGSVGMNRRRCTGGYIFQLELCLIVLNQALLFDIWLVLLKGIKRQVYQVKSIYFHHNYKRTTCIYAVV